MIRSRAIDWRLLMLGKQDESEAGGDGEMLAAAGLPAAARCVLVFQDTTLGRRVNSVASPLSLLARLTSWGAAWWFVIRARVGMRTSAGESGVHLWPDMRAFQPPRINGRIRWSSPVPVWPC